MDSKEKERPNTQCFVCNVKFEYGLREGQLQFWHNRDVGFYEGLCEKEECHEKFYQKYPLDDDEE